MGGQRVSTLNPGLHKVLLYGFSGRGQGTLTPIMLRDLPCCISFVGDGIKPFDDAVRQFTLGTDCQLMV